VPLEAAIPAVDDAARAYELEMQEIYEDVDEMRDQEKLQLQAPGYDNVRIVAEEIYEDSTSPVSDTCTSYVFLHPVFACKSKISIFIFRRL
jgi:ribosomal protein S2